MILDLNSVRIILASASPRRRELLRQAGIENFEIMPPSCGEPNTIGLPPDEAVQKLAIIKCENVSGRVSGQALIIAADTMVHFDGRLLGKPSNEAEAYSMLKRLSGDKHTVYTGLAVKLGDMTCCSSEASDVFFREISDREIKAYIKTGEPMDKAGAYGIQGRGSIFARKIEGDFFNVVGLPLCKLCTMLSEMGVNLL